MSQTRYPEPRDRSAELMRLVLARMGEHHAAFNPMTFAVWYEHLSGCNSNLSAALKALLDRSLKIGDKSVVELHGRHVAPVGDDAFARFTGAMDRLMKSLRVEASKTGSHAGAFGMQLDELSAAIASKDIAQLVPRLAEVMSGTSAMKEVAQTLERTVAESRAEIDLLRAALDRAVSESMLDPLTGILNRRGFDLRLDALLTQAADGQGYHCLVLFDIDHFKKVNDTHGHLVGDRVIRAIGDVLRATATSSMHAVARYGGEEFALIAQSTSTAAGVALAETIRKRCRAMKFRHRASNDIVLTVSVSAGMAAVRRGDDAASLIGRADAALYRSKTEGRDRLTCG